MALIAHQTQGSFSTCSLRCKSSTCSRNWRSCVALQFICRSNEIRLVKPCLRFRCLPFSCPKRKAFRVLYFKANAENETEGRNNDPEFSKSPVNVSCAEPGREDILSESYNAQKNSISYGSDDNQEIAAKSMAIKEIFRKWLDTLRTQTSAQIVDENIDETTENTSSDSQHDEPTAMTTRNRLREVLIYFFRLDAAISIPLLIFIPGCLGVQVRYGAEVTKELMPLWILGPPIVSIYIKIIQGLCSLYLLLFMQAIKVVKNLPAYSLLVYNYVAEGKLKEFLFARFWKPIMDIKNLDYGAFLWQKYKQLEAWAIDKYLDYVESIWPYYCRTIRFLKKAHLL